MLLPAGDRGTAGEPIGHPFARREREHVVAQLREVLRSHRHGGHLDRIYQQDRMVIDK